MRCPYCHEKTPPGKTCEVCGERLPNPSRARLVVAIVISVAIIVAVCAVGVMAAVRVANHAPAPVEVPTLTSDVFEEKPLTLEEEKALARKELAEMEAQAPEGSTIDQIVGYWKTSDYFVHIQKVASATYRWTSTAKVEDVYKIHINNDNRYVMEDNAGVTYVFGMQDFDNLKFYSAKGEDGGLPEVYDIPYKGAWKRTDENGNAIVRTYGDKESFWILGQKFGEVCKYYRTDRAYYDNNMTPVVDMKNKAGTTFTLSFIESGNWSWSKKNDKELNLPPDQALIKTIKAPLSFFVKSQKAMLSAQEIADVLPGDSTPVVSQDGKTTVIKWQRNSQKVTLVLSGVDNFSLNDSVNLRLG